MTTLGSNHTETLIIAVDVMSGDHGIDVIMPACYRALQVHRDVELLLVGDEALIAKCCDDWEAPFKQRVSVLHASEVVEMTDSPQNALKNKKDSSMRIAINAVKSGQASAVVSAGNTGALMATARFVLKMIKGIDRPAICTALPTQHGHVHVLDLGANVDSSAMHLEQFALMGSELVKAVDGKQNPKVGLLNVGSESIKGNEQVKAAHDLLQASPIYYGGFIEGDGIFLEDWDVVVCDGFVGNVALKTSEGLAKFITSRLKGAFLQSWYSKLLGLLVKPLLNDFRASMDPRAYNGASLLGLQGIVIKSHGGADSFSFANAISIARKVIIEQVPTQISEQMSHFEKDLGRAK